MSTEIGHDPMQVDHGGLDIDMHQKFFDGNNIDALYEQIRSISMAKTMHTNLLSNIGFLRR
jgi:hypothetical protein